MKGSTILLILAGLYLYSRSRVVSNPQPGDPGFVGPVQTGGSSAAIPPAVNAPMQWLNCASPDADPVMCKLLQNMGESGIGFGPIAY